MIVLAYRGRILNLKIKSVELELNPTRVLDYLDTLQIDCS